MAYPDLADIEGNHEPIVQAIGQESVQLYLFLSRQFAHGSIKDNQIFQFIFRSFYRLDNAGHTRI